MVAQFPTTHWTELAELRDQNSQGARLVVARLYDRYWSPLYAYLRRRGNDPERASDLLQGFFTYLLDKEVMSRHEMRGKLRAFLLASLKNYVADQRDKEQAQKRRPEQPIVSLDVELAERYYLQIPSNELSPEQVFERRWAHALVERATERVAETERQAGRGADFEQLKSYVVGGAQARPYRELAEILNLSESAIKVRVHRMRKKLGTYLRQDIELTVAEPSAVQGEVRYLMELVG